MRGPLRRAAGATVRALSLAALLAAAGTSAHAAGAREKAAVLGIAARPPAVDGVMTPGEYPLERTLGAVRLGVSRGKGVLYVAASAPAAGWVGVGISPGGTMDGAEMFIGIASGDRGELKVQKGKGHTHSDLDSTALLFFALREANGRTVMELALRSSGLLPEGPGDIVFIAAAGRGRDFTSPHARTSRLAVSLGE
jgi:hypothetical protein